MIAEHNDTKTEFEFHELSPSAKERAIQEHAESLWDDWHSFVIEDWKAKLDTHGFTNPKIYFSGFWSQGDGASFEADFCYAGDAALQWLEPCDLERLTALKVKVRMDGCEPVPELVISGQITQGGHYCHKYTMAAHGDVHLDSCLNEIRDECDDFIESLKSDPIDAILEHARDLADDIYSDLEKEYEYQTSEQNVAEMSKANDWRYDKEGNLL